MQATKLAKTGAGAASESAVVVDTYALSVSNYKLYSIDSSKAVVALAIAKRYNPSTEMFFESNVVFSSVSSLLSERVGQ